MEKRSALRAVSMAAPGQRCGREEKKWGHKLETVGGGCRMRASAHTGGKGGGRVRVTRAPLSLEREEPHVQCGRG